MVNNKITIYSFQSTVHKMAERSEKKKRAKAKDNSAVVSATPEVQADEGSKALLREFMHSKKLLKTLQAFDSEQPRGETTIESRALMADLMLLTDLQKRNKARTEPLKSLLEVICDHRITRKNDAATDPSHLDSDAEEHFASPLIAKQDELEATLASVQEKKDSIAAMDNTLDAHEKKQQEQKKKAKKEKGEDKKKKDKEKGKGKEKEGKKDEKRKKKKMLSIDELLEGGDKRTQQKGASTHKEKTDWNELTRGRNDNNEVSAEQDEQRRYREEVERAAGLFNDSPALESQSANHSSPSEEDSDDYERDLNALSAMPQSQPKQMNWDIDPTQEEAAPDTDTAATTFAKQEEDDPFMPKRKTVHGRPVGPAIATKLKTLLCGRIRVPDSWCQQGFYFSEHVPYGMIQNTGGPCGLLAVIQARVVKHLYFSSTRQLQRAADGAELITSEQQKNALVESLCETFLGVAKGGSVVLVIPPDLELGEEQKETLPCSRIDFESWRSVTVGRDAGSVRQVLNENFTFFSAKRGLGMMCFLISIIFTRGGVDPLASDMDAGVVSEGSLIVCHQYSSQELVSLLLYGKAHSNVFDGIKDMSSGRDKMVLRGAPAQCDVGLLTYQEYTRDIQVGLYLKDPVYPIWIVWNESHYCVAFCKEMPKGGVQKSEKSDVFYYDQLGMQDEEYRLTVDPTSKVDIVRKANDLTPFMDDILRTREQWDGYDFSPFSV